MKIKEQKQYNVLMPGGLCVVTGRTAIVKREDGLNWPSLKDCHARGYNENP